MDRRFHGELLVLGIKVAAPTVWEILQEAGIDPAPERARGTWADFLRSQADALLTSGEESDHGPRGRWLQGPVPDPGP